jgi:hypothetical protein
MTGPEDVSEALRRDGHRLLRVASLLFLLGLLVGLAVPRFTVPRLGLSTHLLGIMQGTFLLVGGLLWPRLNLTLSASRSGHILAIYGCLAAWTANFLAAVWGAQQGHNQGGRAAFGETRRRNNRMRLTKRPRGPRSARQVAACTHSRTGRIAAYQGVLGHATTPMAVHDGVTGAGRRPGSVEMEREKGGPK